MSTKFAVTKRSIKSLGKAADFLKELGGEYIKSNMPMTSNIWSEVSTEAAKIRNSVSGVSQNLSRMKGSSGFNKAFQWFNGALSENDTDGMEYDIGNVSSGSSDGGAVLSNYNEKVTSERLDKLSKDVLGSSYQLAQTQMASTAEIVSSVQELTSVTKVGFDQINTTLTGILNVLTKNSAAMVETNMGIANAISSGNSANSLQKDGRFTLAGYKELVSQNLYKDMRLGMLAAYAPLIKDLSKSMNKRDLAKMGVQMVIDQLVPGLADSMKGLDESINKGIITAFTKLGDLGDQRGLIGLLGRTFGIDSSRKSVSTERSGFEVKQVAFDSITKDAITSAIPGYLRKILIAVGGEDAIYDYRSRRFTTRSAVKKEFQQAMIQGGSSQSKLAGKAFGDDAFGQMVYDLLLADMGQDSGSSQRIKQKKQLLSNKSQATEYLAQLLGGGRLTQADRRRIEQIAANLSMENQTELLGDMASQAATRNRIRYNNASRYIESANLYNLDLSEFQDTVENELEAIRTLYGRTRENNAEVRVKDGGLTGSSYTNRALYQIFRRLDRGINVYQVGSGKHQEHPFDSLLGDLPAPKGVGRARVKLIPMSELSDTNGAAPPMETGPNELLNQEGEDLTMGERAGRWGKSQLKNIWEAVKSRDPRWIQQAFGNSIEDLGGLAGSKLKDGLSKLDQSFGNVTGYLRHKLTGAEYSYMDGDEKVTVKASEKGGVLGFIKDEFKDSFGKIKEKGKSWFSRVSSYFDYGDSKNGDKTAGKRKRFLAASVGAMAGAGILGGPLGLVMGAVAGNALSGMDLGEKFRKMLFGSDEDGKPTGIVSKFADKVITPIQYQAEKTLTKAGAILEKRIIGPISDIGYAIKERAAKAADATFGRVFRFIGKIIMAPFKGIKNAFFKAITGGFTLANKLFRGGMDAGGFMAGGALGGIARLIAPDKDTRDAIKERRKARNREIDERLHGEDSVWSMSYKDYRQKKREERRDRYNRYKDYTSDENDVIIRESVDAQQQTEEHTADIADSVHEMQEQQNNTAEIISNVSEHMLSSDGNHSIFTHDHGVHSYLERIIEIITGSKDPGDHPLTHPITEDSPEANVDLSKLPTFEDLNPEKPTYTGASPTKDSIFVTDKTEAKTDPTDSDDYANSALAAVASVASANGSFTDEEASIAKSAVNEVAKNNSSKGAMSSYLADMIDTQKTKGLEKEAAEEEKETIFDKLFNFLGSGLGSVLTKAIPWILGALGISKLLNLDWDDLGNIISSIGQWIGVIGEGFSDLLAFFGIGNGKAKGNSAVDAGVNAVGSVVDTNVDSVWDLATPGASLYHVQEDGAGNNIVNSAATHAKDEVLYLRNLRKELFQGSMLERGISEFQLGRAERLGTKAATYAERAATSTNPVSAAYNRARSKYYQSKSDKALDSAVDWEQKGNAVAGSTVRGIARQAGRVAVLSGGSKAVGSAVGFVADKLGLSEEASQTVGNVAEVGTAAALTVNAAKSAVKGKTSIIDKILNLITDGLSFLADKLKSTKAFSKIASKIDDIFVKIKNALPVSKFTDDIIGKITSKLGISGTKQIAGAATLGIGIAVGAVAGAASGFCSTEHLFGVLPGEADALMTTISTAMAAAFGALEMVPVVGTVCLIIDILDSIVAGVLGTGIKQYIAQSLYRALGGDENLTEKQAAFDEERNYYNATYGTNLSSGTFNDFVNNTGFFDKIWHGSNQYDEDGHLKFDAAGGKISNGLQQLFVGGETDYSTDANGNVIRKEDGSAVVKKDAYGNTQKVDEKWGDKVGQFFHNAGHFLTGGDVYKTDENGIALVDENGDYIVDHTEKNIFGKIGDQAIAIGNGIVEGAKSLGDSIIGGVSSIGSGIANAASSAADWVSGIFGWGSSKDTKATIKSSGTPSKIGSAIHGAIGKLFQIDTTAEDSKTAKTVTNFSSAIKSMATGALSKIMNVFRSPADAAEEAADEIETNHVTYDAEGNAVKASPSTVVKTVLNKGIGAITTFFTAPAKAVSNLLSDQSVNQNYDMDEDGTVTTTDASNGTGLGLTNLFKSSISNLKTMFLSPAESVKSMLEDESKETYETDADGNVIKTVSVDGTGTKVRKGHLGDYIKSGISSIVSLITSPFQDAATAANDWNKESSPWANGGSIFSWIKDKLGTTWTNLADGIASFLSNLGGTGGPVKNLGGIGDPSSLVDASSRFSMMGTTIASNVASTKTAGGNPLSKAFTVTSPFGVSRNIYGKSSNHYGIDLVPSDGSKQAEISNRYAGTVVGVQRNISDSHTGNVKSNSEGNYVVVETPDGKNRIKYFHLKQNSIPSNIQKGSTVQVGDHIGTMGSTGRSTGPHLHYQLEKKNASGKFVPYDPLPDISGSGTNGSAINTAASSTYFSSTLDNSTTDETSGTGALAQLVSKLSSLGTDFLNQITFGIFNGMNSSSSSSSSSLSGRGVGVSSNGLSVDDFLSMVEKEIGTTDDPRGSNRVKYNTWYYGKEVQGNDYPWCMAFVQWCFNQAGLPLEHKSASCSDMYNWYCENHPEMISDTPQRGDIMIQNAHTGIVEKINQDGSVGTIEGNTSNMVARRNRQMSSIIGFIRPVNWNSLGNFSDTDVDEASLYQYLKSMGFTDYGAAGIMGCWAAESSNKPMRVEWDYSNTFKSYFGSGTGAYDKFASNRNLANEYTTKLFQQYKRDGTPINESAYYASDGNKYPGLGYAQWTGPRGKSLLDTAANSNVAWYNPAYQLAFANTEMTDDSSLYGPKRYNVKGRLARASSASNAAKIFAEYYEGSDATSSRKSAATRIYNAYGVGGPIEDPMDALGAYMPTPPKETFIKKRIVSPMQQLAALSNRQISVSKIKGGIGGPIEDQATSLDGVTSTSPHRNLSYRVSTKTPRSTSNNITTTTIQTNASNEQINHISQLLHQAVLYLAAISTSTEHTATGMSELNQKDFVDQGVRDTLNALGQQKQKASMVPGSGSSKIATGLARP